MRIDQVSHLEVASYLETRDTVIVPLGSCEQQGLHLPMGVETEIVSRLAWAVSERTGHAVVPTLPINTTESFLEFPGVLSVRMDHYYRFLTDYVRGLVQQGFQHIFFVNIHYGSQGPIESVAREIRSKFPNAVVGGCECWTLMQAAEMANPSTDDFPFGHASEVTTSVALHLCPELVRMDVAQAGSANPNSPGIEVLGNRKARLNGIDCDLYLNCSDYQPSGCLGDPTAATADKGQLIFEKMVGATSRLLETFEKIRLDQP